MLDFYFALFLPFPPLDYPGLATTELSPRLHPRMHDAEFRHVTHDKRTLKAAEPRACPLFQPPPSPNLTQSYKE
jgi:hypothetical protein